MFGLYISHPEVAIDPEIPVPDWGLSALGTSRALETAQRPWLRGIARIVSSSERKAIETAEILAEAAGVDVEIAADMGENDRSATGFLAPADFEDAANWFFANPSSSFKGWERAVDAQARVVAAVERILADHDPSAPIIFVGHGGVGTLLKCHFAKEPISRRGDQSGGGNLYAFDLAERRLACGWTKMELWPGWART
jgi:broad specificity phosphatase PhoE